MTSRSLTLSLVSIVIGMVMLAYASVPLYRMFCQITGFGGTPTAARAVTPVDRFITVRFNSDVAPGLPWEFATPKKPMRAQLGVHTLVSYRAKNLSDEAITGMATYNVTPHAMGQYVSKIQCFCFEEQTLNAHQQVNMPVSFVVDPAMLDDPETRSIREITLSYTFFEKRK